jgi:hypothetical protein
MWFLGLGFLAGGIIALGMLLLAGPDDRPDGWGRLLVAVIGSAHVAAGSWLVISMPNLSVWLRRDRPVLHIRKRWLLLRRERTIDLADIAHFRVRQSEDSEGDPVYQLELFLRTGERVALHSVALHGRAEIDAAADRLRAWSGGRLAARVGEPGDLQES